MESTSGNVSDWESQVSWSIQVMNCKTYIHGVHMHPDILLVFILRCLRDSVCDLVLTLAIHRFQLLFSISCCCTVLLVVGLNEESITRLEGLWLTLCVSHLCWPLVCPTASVPDVRTALSVKTDFYSIEKRRFRKESDSR